MEDTRSWGELQADMHQIALDHGWWDKERSPLEVLMLMITELDELDDEFVSAEIRGVEVNRRNVGEELADHCIRLGDAAGFYKLDPKPKPFPTRSNPTELTIAERRGALFEIIKPLAKSAEMFRSLELETTRMAHSLLFCDSLDRAINLAERLGLDLRGAIVAKMEVNRARPYRHGDKTH